MPTTPDDVDISTFSLYISEDRPGLYISPPLGDPTHLHRLLVPMCQSFGLPPLALGEVERVGIGSAGDGWGIEFEYDQGDAAAPLMTIEWPVIPPPMVYGVRKDSPPGWATDAIVAGACALIVGPPLDWERLTVELEPGDAVLPTERFLAALTGHEVAAGVLPVRVRR
ncbi:hypothetical protein [Nonomuraea rubra]|uniref:hypothetical protein n=1 Tax=Nonomuraea rubra TaxID=46180 RepID=UPI0033EB559E